MEPRATIFDGYNERELFDAIHGTWEPEHRVYPHIPFENLLDLDPLKFDPVELEFLHKTTVDYVLTSAEGRPLLAIEFDGLGRGGRRDGHYVQRVQTRKDPKRAWKFNLKCRAADAAGFPYTVVSYEEKEVVDSEANLVIAHGIIGGFLAHRYASRRMQEFYEDDEEYIESLPPDERDEYVQDYVVIPAEVEADLAMNPLEKRIAELTQACSEAGLVICGWSGPWPEEVPAPPQADPASPRFNMRARVDWLRTQKRVGATVGVRTLGGEVQRTAWVRNIDYPGTAPELVAREVAHLLALHSTLALAGHQQPKL